jgi:hypothetical protein
MKSSLRADDHLTLASPQRHRQLHNRHCAQALSRQGRYNITAAAKTAETDIIARRGFYQDPWDTAKQGRDTQHVEKNSSY